MSLVKGLLRAVDMQSEDYAERTEAANGHDLVGKYEWRSLREGMSDEDIEQGIEEAREKGYELTKEDILRFKIRSTYWLCRKCHMRFEDLWSKELPPCPVVDSLPDSC